MNWGLLWGGIAAVAVVAIACILFISSDAPPSASHNGIWAFLLVLPIAIPLAGALVLAGRDD
jgi:hypothetical protein